jgi:hypothetical protein
LLRQKDWVAWKIYSVLKTVNSGKLAFCEQLRLGRQPVLHFMPLRRTKAHINGGLAGRWRKINFVLVQFRNGSGP